MVENMIQYIIQQLTKCCVILFQTNHSKVTFQITLWTGLFLMQFLGSSSTSWRLRSVSHSSLLGIILLFIKTVPIVSLKFGRKGPAWDQYARIPPSHQYSKVLSWCHFKHSQKPETLRPQSRRQSGFGLSRGNVRRFANHLVLNVQISSVPCISLLPRNHLVAYTCAHVIPVLWHLLLPAQPFVKMYNGKSAVSPWKA